jgi:Pilus assembly protein, PilO
VKKTKLPPQALIPVVVLALVVVGALAFFVIVGPQRSKAVDLEKEVAATRVQVDDARAKSSDARNAQPIKVANLFRLSKAMPDQTDMSGLLLQLNGLAADTGIVFDSITPQPVVAQTGYQVVPVQVVFDGNFYNLADLLYRLRNLVSVNGGRLDATGRLFAIDTVDFAEGKGGFPQIQASLLIDAYVYGTGTATGPPTASTPGAGTTTSTTDTGTTTTTPTPTPTAPSSGEATATGAP